MSDKDFLPFRVSTLRGDQRIPFDAFVRVAGKYILFCRQGDSFEGDRLERLRSKNLKRMYLKIEQAGAYDSYIKENTVKAYDQNRDTPFDTRLQIIQGTLQACTEDLVEEPDSDAFFAVALEATKRFIGFIEANPATLPGLLKVKNSDYSIEQHGVNVACLSHEIARQIGYAENRPMQMPHLGLGALIHDIEHHYAPVTLSMPIMQMSQNELRVYNKHTTAGAQRIKDIHFYDQVTRDIIQYHDERIDGSGLQKKKEKDIDPFVFVVAAADSFDQLLTRENLNPKDALKKIMIDKLGVLPLDLLKALQEVLKKTNIA